MSKALGRIVGFFDEERTFNIVLLDPLHNIQPSKSHNYKVDTCNPLSCELSSLKYSLTRLIDGNDCPEPNCKLANGVSNINTHRYSTNILMFNVDDIDIQDADELIETGQSPSYVDIFQLGIVASGEEE